MGVLDNILSLQQETHVSEVQWLRLPTSNAGGIHSPPITDWGVQVSGWVGWWIDGSDGWVSGWGGVGLVGRWGG